MNGRLLYCPACTPKKLPKNQKRRQEYSTYTVLYKDVAFKTSIFEFTCASCGWTSNREIKIVPREGDKETWLKQNKKK